MALPLTVNEPLSMLQRLAESLEYAYLLDKADLADDPVLRIEVGKQFISFEPYLTYSWTILNSYTTIQKNASEEWLLLKKMSEFLGFFFLWVMFTLMDVVSRYYRVPRFRNCPKIAV